MHETLASTARAATDLQRVMRSPVALRVDAERLPRAADLVERRAIPAASSMRPWVVAILLAVAATQGFWQVAGLPASAAPAFESVELEDSSLVFRGAKGSRRGAQRQDRDAEPGAASALVRLHDLAVVSHPGSAARPARAMTSGRELLHRDGRLVL